MVEKRCGVSAGKHASRRRVHRFSERARRRWGRRRESLAQGAVVAADRRRLAGSVISTITSRSTGTRIASAPSPGIAAIIGFGTDPWRVRLTLALGTGETMSYSKIIILVLAGLLVVTNALWAYALTAPGAPEAKAEYRCSIDEHRTELDQEIVYPLAAAIAASGRLGATKQSIVAAASNPSSVDHQFCIRESDVVVKRRVGLRFDANGKLVGASTMLCPH